MSLYLTKSPEGLSLAVSLSHRSLSPQGMGAPRSQRRGGEPGQFHRVHSLEGNKLLRGHVAIAETKPGRDFSCAFPEREDWPNLKPVLAFYSVQDVDGGTKKQRHVGLLENSESGFGSCTFPPSPFSLPMFPQGAMHCWLSTVTLILCQEL